MKSAHLEELWQFLVIPLRFTSHEFLRVHDITQSQRLQFSLLFITQ